MRAGARGVPASPRTPAAPSQTLSRGIRVLELLAETRQPLTIDAIAGSLGVHRSIAYRLLRTLEAHGLARRDAAGRVSLGPRTAVLAAGVEHDLQAEALPELTVVANELGMTAFLAVLDHDECITLTSVQPRHAAAPVAQRPGSRHPITVGAPGKAILATLPHAEWPAGVSARLAEEATAAAARGYAVSHDEVIPSVRSVAVPLRVRGREPAAIAVVYVATDLEPAVIGARLAATAAAIGEALGERPAVGGRAW